MGDSVQVIKAGVMEIADIFVINKADRDGADVLFNEVSMMLDMAFHAEQGWRPPVIKIGSVLEPITFMQGIEELVTGITKHRRYLAASNGLRERMRRKALYEIKDSLEERILEPIYDKLLENNLMEDMVSRVVDRKSDPHTLSEEIAKRYLNI
jgi:LAO/AO transport system kinase